MAGRERYPRYVRLHWMWIIGILVLGVIVGPAAWGQERAAEGRPKIGLALGGGGPRGLAHIGVLEWLAEHRIPIDYIAGTSMGGIVGAMKALGMTTDQMRELVRTIDWEKAFQGAPAHEDRSLRRKEDSRKHPSLFELGMNGGVQVPNGLNPAHEIGLLLNRLTLPYCDVKSFDEFPIPFRCVATDLLAGEAVVLGKGSIADALRATMAIPGAFTPVEMDGTVLADGGLVNILPTDVVREMGADIVIAVDVGTPLGGRESLKSFTGVYSQAVHVMYVRNARRTRPLADILLMPGISRELGSQYEASTALVRLGYQEAERNAAALQGYALEEADWQQCLARQAERCRTECPAPSFVKVEGTNGKAARAIERRLEPYVGEALQSEALEAELTTIRGTGRYDRLEYGLTRIDGRDGLLIRAHEKPYGPPFVALGMDVSVAKSEGSEFTLGSRLTVLDLGGFGSELRADIALGSRPVLAAEWYRPLGSKGWFVAPRAFTRRRSESLFQDGSRVAEFRRNEDGTGVDVGYLFGRRSELRLGYEVSNLNRWVRVGDPTLPNIEGIARSARLLWTFDGQDSAVVPTRGVRATAEGRWFFASPGADGAFPTAELNLTSFRPLAPGRSLFTMLAGGTTFGKDAPTEQEFSLGGLLRLGAFDREELRGSHYLLLGIGHLREVSSLPPMLGGKIYAGGWLEAGSAFDHLDDAELGTSLTGGVIAETTLGPVFLGGSYGDGGRMKLYFTIGRIW